MTALAGLAWLIAVIGPGLAAVRLLGVRVPLVEAVAMAAPVGFGVTYGLGLIASALHLPMLPVCLGVDAALLAAALGQLAVTWRRDPASVPGLDVPRARWLVWRSAPRAATTQLLLLAAVVLGVLAWWRLQDGLTVPPGWDAMHHGFFARQMVNYDTLDSKIVLSSDPARPDGNTSFYPLAADQMVALLHTATGLPISALILASLIAVCGVMLPVGAYALCRRVAPDVSLVPGFAAFATVLAIAPYAAVHTGRFTEVLGPALVPGTVVALLATRERFSWRAVPIGAAAVMGLLGVHTSELPVAVALAGLLCLVSSGRASGVRVRLVRLGFVVGVCVLVGAFVLAGIPGVLNAASQRTRSFVEPYGAGQTVTEALRNWLFVPTRFPSAATDRSRVWTALALLGGALTVLPRWRAYRGLALGYLGFGAFYVAWLSSSLGPFVVLADPWYRNSSRIELELYVLGAAPVGVTLAVAATLLGALPALVLSRWRWASTVVTAFAVLVTVGVWARPPVRTIERWLATFYVPVNSNSQAAFGYLAAHIRPGQRVLDDLENHGELWMYADANVPTLFGNPPLIGLAPTSWKQRLYLRGRLSHIGVDPCVGDLIDKYRVRYVYYSTHKMWAGRPRIRLAALRDTTYFQLVFRSGNVTVYAVRGLPPAHCAADVDQPFPWSTLANAN